MSLSKRIQDDLVTAMKARERARVSVLRLVKAGLKNKEIELGRALSREEEIQLLSTMVKQRSEAIEIFGKAGRTDLSAKETEEKAFIQAYLPEEVSSEEIARVVAEAVEGLGTSSLKDMGRVMKETMARLKSTGKAVDGKVVNAIVRSKLS